MPRFSSERFSAGWTSGDEAPSTGKVPSASPPLVKRRLSMNEVTTYRWSFDEDIHHYRRAGYDGVGVWLRKLRDFGEERGVELLRDSGLAVSNAVYAGGFTGSGGLSIEESVAEARRAIELSAAMRAGSLVLCTGGRNHHTSRHAERLLDSALEALLPHAEASRTPLAIEPMHRSCAGAWSIVTNMEQALRLVRRYDTPWLQLVLDTYHFPVPAERRDLLAELAPHLAVVHLADHEVPQSHDQERCPLGEGRAPLADIVRTLLQSGYDGFFDVELMGLAIEAIDYQRLLEGSRRAFERLVASASPAMSGAACG